MGLNSRMDSVLLKHQTSYGLSLPGLWPVIGRCMLVNNNTILLEKQFWFFDCAYSLQCFHQLVEDAPPTISTWPFIAHWLFLLMTYTNIQIHTQFLKEVKMYSSVYSDVSHKQHEEMLYAWYFGCRCMCWNRKYISLYLEEKNPTLLLTRKLLHKPICIHMYVYAQTFLWRLEHTVYRFGYSAIWMFFYRFQKSSIWYTKTDKCVFVAMVRSEKACAQYVWESKNWFLMCA